MSSEAITIRVPEPYLTAWRNTATRLQLPLVELIEGQFLYHSICVHGYKADHAGAMDLPHETVNVTRNLRVTLSRADAPEEEADNGG